MHLTAEEVYTLVGAVVALLGAASAWLKSHAAQKTAGRAERKANQALNGTPPAPPAGQSSGPSSGA